MEQIKESILRRCSREKTVFPFDPLVVDTCVEIFDCFERPKVSLRLGVISVTKIKNSLLFGAIKYDPVRDCAVRIKYELKKEIKIHGF